MKTKYKIMLTTHKPKTNKVNDITTEVHGAGYNEGGNYVYEYNEQSQDLLHNVEKYPYSAMWDGAHENGGFANARYGVICVDNNIINSFQLKGGLGKYGIYTLGKCGNVNGDLTIAFTKDDLLGEPK